MSGKNPRDTEHCKQLLPFPGRSFEVVTVEKSHQNDFSILSESQSSSLESEETQEVCVRAFVQILLLLLFIVCCKCLRKG